MSEIWIDSISLRGTHMVSNLGRVKRIPHEQNCFKGATRICSERISQQVPGKNEYSKIVVLKDGKDKKFYVHRLIAEAFIENPLGYPCVNHLDGNKHNNNVENLEWCTHQHNMAHANRTGLTSCKTPVVAMKKLIGFWFPSMEEAMQVTGVSKPCICAAAKKRQKTAGGMIWEYC